MQTNRSETLYRRLQRHLDRMPVGFPATESGVEIRILRDLFTPEQAEIALELSLIPEPARVVHKRLSGRFTLDELQERLQEMDDKGVVLALRAEGRETRYAKLIYAVGMYERQVARLTTEMERDGRQYLDEAFGRAFHKKKTPQMRIVPVNKRIAVERAVTTYDHIRGYVQQESTGPFGVIPCICRKGRDLAGEKCRQTEQRDNCLLIGPAAKWAADSCVGRAISREEMLALLDGADEDGLVLEVENTKAPMFVCCCCGCCCGVLGSAKRLEVPADYFSTNFRAIVDPETCEGCGTCLSRCQMDAISVPDGAALIERSRCIGCALCVTTCPSDSIRLEANEAVKTPPDDTKALYMQMLQDRYGAWGMAKIGVRKMLGMKV